MSESSNRRKQLLATEARFRALAERGSDLIAELDEQGRYVFVSLSYERLLGWRADRLLGRNAWEITHPDDREPGAAQFEAMVGGAPPAEYRRMRVAHADGTWHWLETVASTYRTDEGALRVVSSGRLITERVRDEERLRAANALATAEELAGSVAHAVRTPLAALLGTATMLVDESGGENPLAVRLVELARRIDRVVTQSMDLVRSGSISTERVSPASLLQRVTEATAERARARGVQLDVKAEPRVEITVDPALMVTALESLVENAIDAVSESGRVWLSADVIVTDRVLRFRVSDDGPGMGPEMRPEVVKPFFTTKPRGTGLGLPIAVAIVRAHGGALKIGSRSGGGAEIRIDVPTSSGLTASVDTD